MRSASASPDRSRATSTSKRSRSRSTPESAIFSDTRTRHGSVSTARRVPPRPAPSHTLRRMAKTVENDADVGAFLGSVADDTRRADAESLCELMAEETGERPRMWGTGIVGFGRYPMRYADGRTAEWLAVGFAPRKANLVLYLAEGFDGHEEALAALG